MTTQEHLDAAIRHLLSAKKSLDGGAAPAPVDLDRAWEFPFGKHKGVALADVPTDYLQWLANQPPKEGQYAEQDAAQRSRFRAELDYRRSEESAVADELAVEFEAQPVPDDIPF